MRVVELSGGPLDGLFLPVNPESPSFPATVYVFAPEARGWSIYTCDNPVEKASACDVYCLRRGATTSLISRPRNADVMMLVYLRQPNAAEVKEIERIGREHGM